MYRYSDEYDTYYSNINLINSLARYVEVYNFHHYLREVTKHYLIGNSRSAEVVIKIIKKNFEINSSEILQSFIQYARENKPELYFYRFLNVLFLASIANEHETMNKNHHLVRLKIFPPLCLRSSSVRAQKIVITSLDPVSISKITEIICANKITGFYFITKNKNKYKIAFEIVRKILVNNFIEVSSNEIIGPYHPIYLNL
jgi:hypothetical protein